MKQKLLNSFMWRASLLVAFLCCAFSSAWGQTEVTSRLTFASSATSYTADDGSVWTASSKPSYQNGTNSYIYTSDKTFTLSTSSISGTITSIVVSAKRANGNGTNKLTVEVGGGTAIDNVTVTTTKQDFSHLDEYYLNANSTIKITLTTTAKANYLYSVTVTYIPKATITIDNSTIGNNNNKYQGNYYGTYSNDNWAFVVPSIDVMTVSEVSVSGGILSVNSLSGIVPKSTGVMVYSSTAGDKSVFVSKKDGTEPSNNMLHPSSETMSGNDSYFYHLTFDANNPIGFYWGAQDGGDWTFSGSNKAYLKVLKTASGSSVKGFTMNDMANGIMAVETEAESKVIYNLAGQRVNKMQKGIYVVNGKKVLVK